MSRTRLVLVPMIASQPAPSLVIDAAGVVLERQLLSIENPASGPATRTVAVVPGADVLIRWLDLPKGSAAQQRAAALWMLKDDLAATPDRVRLALGPAVAGEPRLACVVAESLLMAWTDWLSAMGLKADVLIPDSLTVPEPFEDDVVTAVGFGPALALRGRRFAAGIEPDLAEVVAAGRRIDPVDDMRRVEQMLIAAALNPVVNLLHGPQAGAEPGRWRRAALLAGIAAVLPLVGVLALAARDDLAARSMTERAEAAARRAFPDMAATADPIVEAERRLSTAPPPGGTATAAAVLFGAVERVEGAELDSFSADPAAGVRATVSYATYQDLEALKSIVAVSGLSLTETSTLDDNGRVVSDVVIGAAQ